MFVKGKSKIVLFCGPRGSGKDVSCNFLKSKDSALLSFSMNEYLIEKTKEFFSLNQEESALFDEAYADRKKKDQLLDFLTPSRTAASDVWHFPALSPRQAMIFVSESWYKPIYGKDCWAKSLLEKVSQATDPGVSNYVCNSAGFDEEVAFIIGEFGYNNVLLVEIYGRGTFDGDSRNYITLEDINRVDIVNDGSIDDFLCQVDLHARSFLYGE